MWPSDLESQSPVPPWRPGIKLFSGERAGNHFRARPQFPVLKLYAYQGCSTCRSAVQWLQQHGIPFELIAIREQPPTTLELEAALKSRGGDLGALFNRSGVDYRALGMKDKLPALSPLAALQSLQKRQPRETPVRDRRKEAGGACGIQGTGVEIGSRLTERGE